MNDQQLPTKPFTSTSSTANRALSITSSSSLAPSSSNNQSSMGFVPSGPTRTQSAGNLQEGEGYHHLDSSNTNNNNYNTNNNGGVMRATFTSSNSSNSVRAPTRLPTGNINHQNITLPNFFSSTIPTGGGSQFVPHTQQMFITNNEKIEKLIKTTFQTQQLGLTKTISFLHNICGIEESYQQKIATECASSNFEVHFPGEIGQVLGSCRSFFYKNAKSSERFAQDVRTCLCDPLSQINKDILKKKKMITQTHEAVCKSHQNSLSQLQSKKKTNEAKRQNLESAEKKWKMSLAQSQTDKTSTKESFFSSLIDRQLNPEQTKAKYEQSLEEYSESEIELQQTKQKYESLVKTTLHPQCKTIAEKTAEQYVETGTILHLYIQHLTKLLEARVTEAQNNLAAFREIVDGMHVEDIEQTLVQMDVTLDEEPKKKRESPSPNTTSPPSEKPRPSNATPIFSVYSQERDDNTIFFDEMLSEIIRMDESDEPSFYKLSPVSPASPSNDFARASHTVEEKQLSPNQESSSLEQPSSPTQERESSISEPIEEPSEPIIPKKRQALHKESNVDNNPQFVKYLSRLTQAKEKINSSEECRIAFCKVLNQKRSKACFKKFFYFQDLAELIGDCLSLAHTENDRNVGRLLLNMTQTFYYYGIDYPPLEEEKDKPKEKKKIFVYSILDDMPCWQDLRFWEFCLYDGLNTEKLARINNHNISLTEEQMQAEHENIVFGLLSSFCFTMNEMHIPQDIIRKFAEKMCDINSLNEDYRTMIMSVVASENNDAEPEHHVKMSRYRSKRQGVSMTDEQLSQLRNDIRRESIVDIGDE